MSVAGLEAPYSIATIPKPLDSTHGKIHASPVLKLQGSRKRKRHEVAVGVDGEAVNIYNVQNQSLITTYALSPQTYLCHPPLSIYARFKDSGLVQRKTYLVVNDRPEGLGQQKLVILSESLHRNASSAVEFLSPTTIEMQLPSGGVAALDVSSSSSGTAAGVLINYSDGRVAVLEDDKLRMLRFPKNTRWPPGTYDRLVQHAALLNLEEAKKGILKSREDVVALLTQMNDARPIPQLLFRVVSPMGRRRLELFVIRDTLECVMEAELPSPAGQRNQDDARYDFHEPSGTLYELLERKLTVFDLSGTVPKVVMELGSRSEPILSYTRISVSSVLVSTANEALIYETTYHSVLGSTPFTSSAGAASGLKRKRGDHGDSSIKYEHIAVFTKLGIAIGRTGDQLMAIQLGESLRGRHHARYHGTLLSGVIGKGPAEEHSRSRQNSRKARRPNELADNIGALVNATDTSGLEGLVADGTANGENQQASSNTSDKNVQRGANGDEKKSDQDEWPVSLSVKPEHLEREKVVRILGKICKVDCEHSDLRFDVTSPNLLIWFAMNGFLTAECVRKALRESTSVDPAGSVKPGDIMKAIYAIDPDFQLLHHLLSMPVAWEVEEVVRVLELAISSFDSSSADAQPLALPMSTHQQDDNTQMSTGDTAMTNGVADSQLDLESLAAERELEHVFNTLNTGLEVRSDLLRMILQRLYTFPQALVTSTMRTMLSQRELLFFVHLLRIELADGGWTSKYVDLGDEGEDEDLVPPIGTMTAGEEIRPSDHALRAIGALLNCAVDAIGTSGWLVGLGSDVQGTAELLDHLRAEVSAGLEGCWEAEHLETYLREVGKYAVAASDEKIWNASGDAVDQEAAMLPLGSAPDALGALGKGSDRKSKMAWAREKSRRVGKYSFERIRI